ncbi:carbohydrate ABC transporter permease [Paenibacillus sp. J5C_2022]|uniref:carbohydrate ABC transporter permease n=1 Tax=Paenibacillus sp. J5C2022 TaxID=2977129 RepID=UPI0021D24430|nr:carbohydrate ABC transporter permease [Paenibacillus sp. J5C2022]MCU6709048.1 carbohydrate ABC transporter permease [Paenibacillus sp. J5C2022]
MMENRQDVWTERIIAIILGVVSLIVLYPLWYVFIASISSPEKVLVGEVWLWPSDLQFVGYERLLQNGEVIRGYANTIMYTVGGTALNLALTIAAAYPLSRKDFDGRGLFTGIIVFTMFFGGGLIPTYLLVKDLNLLNTFWALILPSAISVWNVIIMRTFFQTGIPYELQEAAFIDGCSNMQALIRIILPISGPVIAVMLLFYGVSHWNAYFSALMYLTNRDLYPLQLILREILIQGQMQDMVGIGDDTNMKSMMDSEAIKFAAVIVANLPMLILYPFLQKYFVRGVMIGAIKG